MTMCVELPKKRTVLAVLAAATSGVNQASGSRFATVTNADKKTNKIINGTGLPQGKLNTQQMTGSLPITMLMLVRSR